MNDLVKYFSNSKIGINKLTSVTFEDNPIFFIKEIEQSLGYENLTNSIIKSEMLIEDIDFIKLSGPKLNKLKDLLSLVSITHEPFNKFAPSILVLTESGLNTLILSSRKPNAKQFRIWVTKEVLPSIRKKGSYSVKSKALIDSTNKELAVRDLESDLRFADLLEVPKHIGQIEAVKNVKKNYNLDISNLLASAPAQQQITDKEVMLEPTDIGKAMEPEISGIAVNKRLKALGLQERKGKNWEPTPVGETLSFKNSWFKGNKSGYNLKWKLKEIKELFDS